MSTVNKMLKFYNIKVNSVTVSCLVVQFRLISDACSFVDVVSD